MNDLMVTLSLHRRNINDTRIILAVLLDDDMTYTHEEIDEILQNEFNRPIVEVIN